MRVTPEQIEKAKQIDLLTYLQSYEPNNLKKISHDTWCTKEHDSLKISNGKWHWFSRHIGGKTALDYLIKVKGISFVQAVEIITGYSAVLPPVYTPAQKSNQPKTLELPESNSDICAVRRYLKSRGIADAIIDYCRNNRLLYEDAKYHNCIFLGYDGNTPKYGAVRSTNSDFKRDLTGSDKRFSFFIPAESKTQTVHLFESAIDLLSYATLELRHGQSRHDDLLSLAGVYKTENKQDIPLALKTYLDRHKETKVIYLHLDNDEVGRTATRQITDALSAEYTVIDQPPQSGKDFNDFLKNEIQKKAKGAGAMKIKIYQINMDRDNGSYSFTNYENTIRRTGGGIRSSIYDCVFDGEVACKGLEEVYEKFNIDSPPGFKGHSLSVSDIVEIAESDSVEKGYYFCDSIGFKKIDFEPEKAEKNMDNKITVVLVEPGKLARIAQIGTSLSELQAAVDGNIETFYPYEEQVCIVCNV